MQNQPQNIGELLREGWMHLERNGVPNARRNAEWMLASALECRVLDLFVESRRRAPATGTERYRGFLSRRVAREPLQYITGETSFMSLPFKMSPGVFVPRPDTEVLVERMEVKLERYSRAMRILDLCSGSGVIGIALASRLANCEVIGVDSSEKAVRLAAENALLNGVKERVGFVHSSAEEYLSAEDFDFTAVVCNPPYIASEEIGELPPEVRDHESRDALDGGPDGLDFYRRAIPRLGEWVQSGGYAAFEIGATQRDAVIRFLESESFGETESYRDYSGHDRVVIGRRSL
jgi:release factor glutamine methyltransferase